MIRIPTGPVPKNYARTASIALGAAALVVTYAAPQFLPLVMGIGKLLLPLGITLGSADK